jgi:hypothetical protein
LHLEPLEARELLSAAPVAPPSGHGQGPVAAVMQNARTDQIPTLTDSSPDAHGAAAEKPSASGPTAAPSPQAPPSQPYMAAASDTATADPTPESDERPASGGAATPDSSSSVYPAKAAADEGQRSQAAASATDAAPPTPRLAPGPNIRDAVTASGPQLAGNAVVVAPPVGPSAPPAAASGNVVLLTGPRHPPEPVVAAAGPAPSPRQQPAAAIPPEALAEVHREVLLAQEDEGPARAVPPLGSLLTDTLRIDLAALARSADEFLARLESLVQDVAAAPLVLRLGQLLPVAAAVAALEVARRQVATPERGAAGDARWAPFPVLAVLPPEEQP